jgi:hypothetical protein
MMASTHHSTCYLFYAYHAANIKAEKKHRGTIWVIWDINRNVNTQQEYLLQLPPLCVQ